MNIEVTQRALDKIDSLSIDKENKVLSINLVNYN